MTPVVQAGGALLFIVAFAYLLARAPRRLVLVDLGAAHSKQWELRLALGLALSGLACFLLLSGAASLAARTVLSVVITTLLAVVYYDFRFMVIPDLYNLAIAAAAILSPIALALPDALWGATVCAALFGAVAWLWRKRTGIDGLGLGDVKLSAALGGLLGLQAALWTIALAAATGAVLGYGQQAFGRRKAESSTEEPMVVPFGAALALVGCGFLIWTRR
jgi:leader peptidase (prepilin peptidase)/N-methyltransferase